MNWEKRFLRIKIVQTLGKEIHIVYLSNFHQLWSFTLHILDSNQSTHFISRQFFTFWKVPSIQTLYWTGIYAFTLALIYFISFYILTFSGFLNIPRDVDPQSLQVISSHSGQLAKILRGNFSIYATEKNTSKMSLEEFTVSLS